MGWWHRGSEGDDTEESDRLYCAAYTERLLGDFLAAQALERQLAERQKAT